MRNGHVPLNLALQVITPRFDNRRNALDEICKGYVSQVLVRAQAHGDSIVWRFCVADYKHIGYLLKLRFSYLRVYALAARVYFGTHTCCSERLQDFERVLQLAIGD